MLATTLIRTVVWRLSVLLGDTDPQFGRWPEDELLAWLQEAEGVLFKFLPSAGSRLDGFKLEPGTRQSIALIQPGRLKPGTGITPTMPVLGDTLLGAVRNLGEDGLTPGRAIRTIDRDAIDGVDPMWHTRTGPFVTGLVYDPSTPRDFYVTPGVPAGASRWIEIAYTAQPPAYPTANPGAYGKNGSASGTIGVRDEHVSDLIDYAMARAHQKDAKHADEGLMVMHTQRFLASLNAKVLAETGTNPNLRMLPGIDVKPGERRR